MPIVLDPNIPNPGTATTAASSDALLTVYVDSQYAGVLLTADFSGLGTPPLKVRFYRDGVPVRSGDAAWAPGGYGRAYDHEAPLGVSSSWTAVPVFADGSTGSSTTAAAVFLPFDIVDGHSVWLKSIDNPSLSMKLLPIFPLPAFTRAASVAFTRVAGSAYPMGSIDKRQARTAEYHFFTDGEAERDDLITLLDGDDDTDTGVLLLQHAASHHVKDIYCIAGDIQEIPMDSGMQDADREWVVPLTEVKRPPTIDSPLYVPGHSWDEARAVAGTWDGAALIWPTWDDALIGVLPSPDALSEEFDTGSGEGGL